MKYVNLASIALVGAMTTGLYANDFSNDRLIRNQNAAKIIEKKQDYSLDGIIAQQKANNKVQAVKEGAFYRSDLGNKLDLMKQSDDLLHSGNSGLNYKTKAGERLNTLVNLATTNYNTEKALPSVIFDSNSTANAMDTVRYGEQKSALFNLGHAVLYSIAADKVFRNTQKSNTGKDGKDGVGKDGKDGEGCKVVGEEIVCADGTSITPVTNVTENITQEITNVTNLTEEYNTYEQHNHYTNGTTTVTEGSSNQWGNDTFGSQ